MEPELKEGEPPRAPLTQAEKDRLAIEHFLDRLTDLVSQTL